MSEYISFFQDIDSSSIGLVGGKAANLGELTRAQFPVPQGFCINTRAYRRVIEANGLDAAIAKALDGLDYDNVPEIERRAASIRGLFTRAALPADVEAEIRRAYAGLQSRLGEGLYVSVRSSATAEDLPGMSFAGQQDTYLDIRGVDAVLEHVPRCWASLWNARAIAYRHRQGFRHEDVLLAVVIQEMFPSEVAGVMFTANPVTSNPAEIFLNTSWGLGEAIVSGHVNPDRYIVDKASLAIKDCELNEKLHMTVRREDGQGTRQAEVPAEKRSSATLPDAKIRELAGIAVRIEQHYGFPQDIEWGYAGGRFAILQSREVTAADLDFAEGLEAWQTPKALAGLTDERWVWSRSYSDELQTGPSSPFMYTGAQPHRIRTRLLALQYMGVKEFAGYRTEDLWDIPYFRWYCSRAYYNTYFEKEWIRRFIPPFARDATCLIPFPEDEREEIRNMPFNWFEWIAQLIRLEFKHPERSLLGSTHHLYEHFEEDIRKGNEVWAKFDMEKATVKEIVAAATRSGEILRAGDHVVLLEANVAMPFNHYLYWLPHGLQKLCALWCEDHDASIFATLTSGLHTRFSDQNSAIWRLSRIARSSSLLTKIVLEGDPATVFASLDQSEEGRKFRAEVDTFLAEYGQGGSEERDPIYLRWAQQPEKLLPSIRTLGAMGEEGNPESLETRLRERMLKTKEECLRKIRRQKAGALKAAFFKWYVELVQDYFYYRDWERFNNNRNLMHHRPMLLAIGRKFVARGLMADPEDMFFIGKQELHAIDEGRLTAKDVALRVRARRKLYDKYRHRAPPKYVRGWQGFDDEQVKDAEGALRGVAASNGVVTGRARVCRELSEITKIAKGDILVTHATDPAWTAVYSIVGGTVVETGGVVSHAVMISREYGIPCVANLSRACDLIPDGALITVDGGAGRVVIHEEET
ncbi:MAG: PEP/pyruvate-binding domain-containing protein [Steroidobacteraceae bacterium]